MSTEASQKSVRTPANITFADAVSHVAAVAMLNNIEIPDPVVYFRTQIAQINVRLENLAAGDSAAVEKNWSIQKTQDWLRGVLAFQEAYLARYLEVQQPSPLLIDLNVPEGLTPETAQMFTALIGIISGVSHIRNTAMFLTEQRERYEQIRANIQFSRRKEYLGLPLCDALNLLEALIVYIDVCKIALTDRPNETIDWN